MSDYEIEVLDKLDIISDWFTDNGELLVVAAVICAGCLLINSFVRRGWMN